MAFFQNPVHGHDGLREMAAWVTADVRHYELADLYLFEVPGATGSK